MSRKDENIIGYVVGLVSEFAAHYGISARQAYAYLKRFHGLDHFYEFYDVMHTLSFRESVESLAMVCAHNGGEL